MNKLNEAAETLKTSWCTGRYKKDLPDGLQQFCAVGALTKAFVGDTKSFNLEQLLIAEKSDEAKVLADVILENYEPELTESFGSNATNSIFDATDIIIEFNDRVAQHSDEVVAMFEKAAVKFDEKVPV